MLRHEDNELLVRVGRGTPMGSLLRQYWTPAVRAERLVADGAPVRVRIMGSNFVAFRATDGRVGFLDEACPHRCASLALARNEDNALRCIFHGWKIDVSGKVVDVPSEPAHRRGEFAAKIQVNHYPVHEAGGIVWVYLGKEVTPPEFPHFEFMSLPSSHVNPVIGILHANWVQGFEALLDSAHAGILHQSWLKPKARLEHLEKTKVTGRSHNLSTVNTGPKFEFIPTPYGFRDCALRELPDGTYYARMRDVVLPYYAFSARDAGLPCMLVAAVPIDDEWTAQWAIAYDPYLSPDFPKGPIEGTSGDPDNYCSDMGNVENLWHQDRTLMKEGHFTGISRCIPYEDFAVQESMGPIVDRSKEYLGTSDTIIIKARRMLLKAVKDFEAGKPAFGLNGHVDYSQLRALAIQTPSKDDWKSLDPLRPPLPLGNVGSVTRVSP